MTVENGSKMLYHATYKRYLDSIKQYGLGGNIEQKAWSFSNDGVVCLAHELYEAESYAENAEITEEDETLLDEIIVLEIDVDRLDKELLFTDTNIRSEDGTLEGNIPAPLEYRGVIPFEAVKRVIDMSR